MSSSEPPPPNPILTAYEGWVSKTPMVTRYILSLQVISYLASWIVNPHYALATIPDFILYRLEVYRFFTAPLVNTSILSLLFSFLSFSDTGRRLEQSMGSTAFGWTCLVMGVTTNIIFCTICVLLGVVFQTSSFLFWSSSGLWTILFGLLAAECLQAPRNSQRALFFAKVPVRWYPVALCVFFGLMSGNILSLPYFLSLGVGYAWGFGYLDELKLSTAKAKQWEDTLLANFAQREGWVAGHASLGCDAWSDMGADGSQQSSVMPLFNAGAGGSSSTGAGSQNANESSGAPRAGSVFKTGRSNNQNNNATSSSIDSSTTAFPSASARTLGGSSTTRRTAKNAAETRAARLQALERRAKEEQV